MSNETQAPQQSENAAMGNGGQAPQGQPVAGAQQVPAGAQQPVVMQAAAAPAKKPLYKRVWFWILVVVVVIVIVAAASGSGNKSASENATTQPDSASTQSADQGDSAATEEKKSEEAAVPAEYKSALNKADFYANTMNMSKQGVYDQLSSSYGEKFSAEAAQYAIDNVKADWNANALAKAKTYQDTMSMSPSAIHDQLTSSYGEKFTEEEADYAIANL